MTLLTTTSLTKPYIVSFKTLQSYETFLSPISLTYHMSPSKTLSVSSLTESMSPTPPPSRKDRPLCRSGSGYRPRVDHTDSLSFLRPHRRRVVPSVSVPVSSRSTEPLRSALGHPVPFLKPKVRFLLPFGDFSKVVSLPY